MFSVAGCRLSVLRQTGRQTEPKQTERRRTRCDRDGSTWQPLRTTTLTTQLTEPKQTTALTVQPEPDDDVDPDDVAGDVSGADDVATVAGRRRR